MAGHSKWSTIKRKKGATDAQRAKIFTKIGREITVAVRSGGPDPETNSRLKVVVAKARANNMPGDNVKRCIQKAAGGGDTSNYEEITYEGYGVGGVAVMVQTLTDNRNRTVSDLRHYFDKYGGSLGQTGCVSYMFNHRGVIYISSAEDQDALFDSALQAGADDVEFSDEGICRIETHPNGFLGICDSLRAAGYESLDAELQFVPQNEVELADESDIIKMNKLVELLEENIDVQNFWHNWKG